MVMHIFFSSSKIMTIFSMKYYCLRWNNVMSKNMYTIDIFSRAHFFDISAFHVYNILKSHEKAFRLCMKLTLLKKKIGSTDEL